MSRTIKIGKKEIGFNKPVFVIAEAGVNHNGRLGLTKIKNNILPIVL